MLDFVKSSRTRSLLSEVTYIALNLLLAAVVTIAVYVTQSWILPLILVLLSKWRIFAVRPRFWVVNIKSNLVDIIVGISFVLLIYWSGGASHIPRIIMAVLYAVWLLLIKPRSSQFMIELQALIALFLGTASLTRLLFEMPSIALVIASLIIGYAVARHVLLAADNSTHVGLISLTFAIVLAELAWISYHWLASYIIPNTGIVIPQFSIFAAFLAFATLAVYKSYLNNSGKIKRKDVLAPIIFSLVIVFALLIGFSGSVIIS